MNRKKIIKQQRHSSKFEKNTLFFVKKTAAQIKYPMAAGSYGFQISHFSSLEKQ
jgi:hypothetical protein